MQTVTVIKINETVKAPLGNPFLLQASKRVAVVPGMSVVIGTGLSFKLPIGTTIRVETHHKKIGIVMHQQGAESGCELVCLVCTIPESDTDHAAVIIEEGEVFAKAIITEETISPVRFVEFTKGNNRIVKGEAQNVENRP